MSTNVSATRGASMDDFYAAVAKGDVSFVGQNVASLKRLSSLSVFKRLDQNNEVPVRLCFGFFSWRY